MDVKNDNSVDDGLKRNSFDIKSMSDLKNENLLLKDKLMVFEEQNRVLNHIRVQSLECMDILETIVNTLDTTVDNGIDDPIEEICYPFTPEVWDQIECEVRPEVECMDTHEVHVLAVPQESQPVPEELLPIPDEVLPVPEETLPVPEETLPEPEETLPVPEETLPEPEETLPVPEETLPVPEETLPVPEETLPVPEEILPVPEEVMATTGEPDVKVIVNELKDKYYNCCHRLEDWIKQLKTIECIKSYPRINCHKYVDKSSFVRRSNRQALPVQRFSRKFTQIKDEDLLKKLSSEELKMLSKDSRMSCPYPRCGFTTPNGAIGLKEHSLNVHTRQISDNTTTASKVQTSMTINVVEDGEDSEDGESGLRCPHPNCNYVTTTGVSLRVNLSKHIKRCHSRKNGRNVLGIGLTQNKNQNKLFFCSYGGCHYKTCYKIALKRHIQRSHRKKTTAPAYRPTPLTSIAFENAVTDGMVDNMTNITNNISDNNMNKTIVKLKAFTPGKGPILRCSKCNFTTNTLRILRNHLRIHKREAPFKCDRCDASFSRTSDLTVHKKSRHNAEPVVQKMSTGSKWMNACSICRKNFRWPSDLKRHKCSYDHKTTVPVISSQPVTPESQGSSDSWKGQHQCPHDQCLFSTDKMGLFQKHVITHILDKKPQIDDNFDDNIVSQTIDLKTEFDDIAIIDDNRGKRLRSHEKVNKTVDPLNVEQSEDNCRTPLSKRLMQSLLNVREDNNDHKNEEIVENKHKYKCVYCVKSYTKLNLLKAHQRLKNHYTYDCEHCDQMFKDITRFQIHVMSAHESSPQQMPQTSSPRTPNVVPGPNVCDYPNCNKSFLLLRNKLTHMKRVHNTTVPKVSVGGDNPMLGTELLTLLKNKSPSNGSKSLLRHQSKCPLIECSKSFGSSSKMLNHFNNSHKNINNNQLFDFSDGSVRCTVCGHLFLNDVNMRRHRTMAHKSGSMSQTSNYSEGMSEINPELFSNESIPQNSGYQCLRTGCGKWFESALDLRQHLNCEHNRYNETFTQQHNEQAINESVCESFRCELCGTGTTGAQELQSHYRFVHSIDSQNFEDSQQRQDLQNIFETNGNQQNHFVSDERWMPGVGIPDLSLESMLDNNEMMPNITIKTEDIY